MNIKLNDSDLKQAIQTEEAELTDLLTRVMSEPLSPLNARVKSLEDDVAEVHQLCMTISEIDLASLASEIYLLREEVKKVKSNGEKLAPAFNDSLLKIVGPIERHVALLFDEHEMLKTLVACVDKRVSDQHLAAETSFAQCDAMLTESLVGIGVTGEFARTAAQCSEAAVTGISKAHELVTNSFQETRAAVQDSAASLEKLGDATAGDVRDVGTRLNTISRSVQDEIKEQSGHLQQVFASLEQRLETSRKDEFDQLRRSLVEVNTRATRFQKRAMWLGSIATIALLATLGLLIRDLF